MILLFNEIPGKESNEGKEGVREYHRRFVIETAHASISSEQIKQFELFPQRWERHPDDNTAFCVSRRCTQDKKGSRFWTAECFYTTDVFSEIENPLERPPDVKWGTVEYTEARLTDLDGKPLVSTAGEPLADIQIESPGLVADVTVNLPDKPLWFRGMINAVNQGTVSFDGESFKAGELRIKALGCSSYQTEQRIRFRQLTMQLQSREGGWQKQVLNRGYYQLVEKLVERDGVEKKVKFPEQIKVDGVPAVEPQLLTREGSHLKLTDDDGQLIEEELRKVYVIDFKVRPERDFSILPLS